jgi:hypothetical protein
VFSVTNTRGGQLRFGTGSGTEFTHRAAASRDRRVHRDRRPRDQYRPTLPPRNAATVKTRAR